ncbi:MAG: triacylglycerol lipase [Pseudomonadales bacterium]|nr:triacylglycerol lipase [Pseudomonadales bacterium]
MWNIVGFTVFSFYTLASLLLAPLSFAQTSQTNGYTATKYPLVYVPGMYGFEKIAGIDYWFNIPRNLEKDGAVVFTLDVSGLNTPEYRGEQVIAQVEEIVAITGVAKVNLLGHSHGAPTIRYVAAVRPDLVASVTSIAGVNAGVNGVDAVNSIPEGSFIESMIAFFGNGLGNIINYLSGANDEQDFLASVRSMSRSEMDKFNARYPQAVPSEYCGEGEQQVNGIYYYSWSGADPTTNIFDPSDLVFSLTALSDLLNNQKSDGLVSRCVTHLGSIIRDDFKMNHLDPMNWVFGLTSSKARPIAIHRAHANRLKNAGL